MICPDWQYPHWGTCSAIHAVWSAFIRSGESPSMVVTFRFAAEAIVTRHDLDGSPSM
jgi:hypothetical protein